MQVDTAMRRASPANKKATTCMTLYRRRCVRLIPNLLASHKLASLIKSQVIDLQIKPQINDNQVQVKSRVIPSQVKVGDSSQTPVNKYGYYGTYVRSSD